MIKSLVTNNFTYVRFDGLGMDNTRSAESYELGENNEVEIPEGLNLDKLLKSIRK